MSVFWNPITWVKTLCQILLCVPVSSSESGTVSITGGDVAVERGQQVEFRCNTSAWYPEPDVTWALNGAAVDRNSYNTNTSTDGNFYDSTSVLSFHAISNATVECRATVAALQNPISSSVFLAVGKKNKHGTLNTTEVKLVFALHHQDKRRNASSMKQCVTAKKSGTNLRQSYSEWQTCKYGLMDIGAERVDRFSECLCGAALHYAWPFLEAKRRSSTS